MIPVALRGVNQNSCETFFDSLPELLRKANITDSKYERMLYKIEGALSMKNLHIINDWLGIDEFEWEGEIEQEVLSALEVIRYPDVSLVENLLTIDGIDCFVISNWLHFMTNVYPIYDERACVGIRKLGLSIPFDSNDIASYGLYVSLIEALKEYAPAGALPEYALPRQRLLQVGLAQWAEIPEQD